MKKDFILSVFLISILASCCEKEDIPESDYLKYTSNIDNSNQIKKENNVDFIKN